MGSLILFAGSFITLVTGLLLADKDIGNILLAIGASLAVAVLIMCLFNPAFGYKPTREEIEEDLFGDKERKN